MSFSVQVSTLAALKEFFVWLAWQPGFKSKIHVPDIDYFSPSMKDSARAKATKRQNQLTHGHIEKIVSTYQFRTEEDRYSKRIAMERIAEEGYNLNISRYISTATIDEEIDLGAVNAELVSLEQKIEAATKKHNEFLKELGLPLLPG